MIYHIVHKESGSLSSGLGQKEALAQYSTIFSNKTHAEILQVQGIFFVILFTIFEEVLGSIKALEKIASAEKTTAPSTAASDSTEKSTPSTTKSTPVLPTAKTQHQKKQSNGENH